MNYTEKINEIYRQIQSTHDNCLSTIIPQIYPISIECKDYDGFLLLFFWEKPLQKSKEGNKTQFEQANRFLRDAGLSQKEIDILQNETFNKYINLRTIENDQVCSLSAKEMEDYFARLEKLFATTELPSGMAPVDIYFKSEQAKSERIAILESRTTIEKQYAVLQAFITSKLAYYQSVFENVVKRKPHENGMINTKKVFVIHGHNEAKRRELENLLKDKFDLFPIVLADQPSQGLTIIEKFEKYALDCSYAFALFTPDDIVTDDSGNQYFQARPNVIFELGWFYAKLGRSRVCILDQASEKSIIFTDLQGVTRIQFNKDISEKFIEIERELHTVGII